MVMILRKSTLDEHLLTLKHKQVGTLIQEIGISYNSQIILQFTMVTNSQSAMSLQHINSFL